jgi:hypothetical protein
MTYAKALNFHVIKPSLGTLLRRKLEREEKGREKGIGKGRERKREMKETEKKANDAEYRLETGDSIPES